MKFSVATREKLIEVLTDYEHQYLSAADWGSDDLYDFIKYGRKGMVEKTDEELFGEFRDNDLHRKIEHEELYKTAATEIAITDLLKEKHEKAN